MHEVKCTILGKYEPIAESYAGRFGTPIEPTKTGGCQPHLQPPVAAASVADALIAY